MEEQSRFTIHVEHLQNYEFNVKFDWDEAPDLLMDEPPPLGQQHGPNASRLLAAAVANCLSASLLFCLKKNEAPAQSVKTQVTCMLTRNEKQRLRIGGMEVQICADTDHFDATRLKRCLQMFEDFCVVTASIREGIPVSVKVVDQQGVLIHTG
ncbi:MAG: osmotically inducible protein OsmC [Gammaproteobacteria bacterium SG8_11]|nr:MAG: osmotically inducible protein OsmC [Gammaproteobacteria bacterium SG8_11]